MYNLCQLIDRAVEQSFVVSMEAVLRKPSIVSLPISAKIALNRYLAIHYPQLLLLLNIKYTSLLFVVNHILKVHFICM